MRVEVSLDGGQTWLETELLDDPDDVSDSDSDERKHPRVLPDGSLASSTASALHSSPSTEKEKEVGESLHETYAWSRWRVRLPAERVLEAVAQLPGPKGEDASNTETQGEGRRGVELHVMCRATDSSYGTQPLDVAPIWNMRGLLHTAAHRISLNLNLNLNPS